jgi:16S rRNA processing protein RimM
MNKSDAFYLGYISRKHGYKGALNIKLDVSSFKELKELDFLFIDLNKSLVPFFIEELSFKNNNFIIVKFEDINDEFDVNQLIGKGCYISSEKAPKNNELLIRSYIGYSIIDSKRGNIGVIEDITSNTAQNIFQINFEGKQILIPIVEEFIKKIDKEKNTIYLNVPIGLIDIYLD